MKHRLWLVLAALAGALATRADDEAVERRPPHRLGLVAVGDTYFPIPEDTEFIPVPGGGFETDESLPADWAAENEQTRVVLRGDAPRGRRCLHLPGEAAATAIAPSVPIPGNVPLLVSFWWKADCELTIYMHNNSREADPRINSSGKEWFALPTTDGRWQRIGVVTRAPEAATRMTLQFRCRETQAGIGAFLDDVRARTATEAEMAAAWRARESRRDRYPIPPRPSDGRNLALTVRKLRGGGMPGRPFIVWALGSSFTNFLGNGEDLRQEIAPRFPNAPPVVYRKHVGGGTLYQHVRGWVRQFAVHDYPDLILIYATGDPDALEDLLRTIRRSCTADVVLASMHFWARAQTDWAEVADTPYWDRVRETCRKHGVEFVENRRELAQWFEKEGTSPTDILGDQCHQNERGRRLINLNIARHVAVPEAFSYDPRDRERRVPAVWALRQTSAMVRVKGAWTETAAGLLRSDQEGATLALSFTGNRVDILGDKLPDGGSVRVRIDGRPADEVPAFVTTHIRPHQERKEALGPMPGDFAPHAARLGDDLVPQQWTLRMTGSKGAFELVGSVTGHDGRGSQWRPFVSDSGQIRIAPEAWRRHGRSEEGDTFSFRVERGTTSRVGFDGISGERLRSRLGQALGDRKHTVELEVVGDGPVLIDSFYVFDPPGEEPK